MTGLKARVDEFQRRHAAIGFPLAVVYKYVDDQAGYLAAIVTYYAFVAIFPLLLIASSVLGFLLQGNEELKGQVLSSALSQFPIVGTQLGRPEGLHGSASAVTVGAIVAIYGVIGLGQAAQNAVNAVWAVPRNQRRNPVASRAGSLVLLLLAGLAVLAVTALSSVASHVNVFGEDFDRGFGWVLTMASIFLNAVVLAAMMRLATTARQTFRATLPGAITVALLWQLLQSLGGMYVSRVIARTNEMNAVFAVVLGLVALLYIASVMAMIGLEINVVLGRRLFPRALLAPFTDQVDLTAADRHAYVAYAKAQRHKGFEQIVVTFQRRRDRDR
jgi:YihY family inner membrane protein